MRAWLMTALLMMGTGAQAGELVDLQVVDRDSGSVLPVHGGHGKLWIAGVPGHRYSVRLANRSGERVLAVLSVDGVNAVSGQTASTQQTGYVLGPWQQMDVDGWRKDLSQVAAFEFTASSNSYAARTGRPGNVGVIGVAVFREKRYAPPPPMPQVDEIARDAAPAGAANGMARAPGDHEAKSRGRYAQQESIGTGHGQREWSAARQVSFERESSAPYEVISLNYDSHANLAAMGILPQPWRGPRSPEPFPIGFVPDPR